MQYIILYIIINKQFKNNLLLENMRKRKLLFKDYLYTFLLLGLLTWGSYTYELIKSSQNKVLATKEVEKIVEKEKVIEKEVVKPFLITEKLPKNYNEKKEMIMMYLRHLEVPDSDLKIWDHIIQIESRYEVTAVPETWVKHCQNSNGTYAKELWAYENGVKWQYKCEFEGATEVHQEQSYGLLQILPSTWNGHKCEGDQKNWQDQIKCGVRIKRQSGFTQWAAFYSYQD